MPWRGPASTYRLAIEGESGKHGKGAGKGRVRGEKRQTHSGQSTSNAARSHNLRQAAPVARRRATRPVLHSLCETNGKVRVASSKSGTIPTSPLLSQPSNVPRSSPARGARHARRVEHGPVRASWAAAPAPAPHSLSQAPTTPAWGWRTLSAAGSADAPPWQCAHRASGCAPRGAKPTCVALREMRATAVVREHIGQTAKRKECRAAPRRTGFVCSQEKVALDLNVAWAGRDPRAVAAAFQMPVVRRLSTV